MKSPAPIKVHASSVEMIPLAQLAAYEANARTHPEDQIASLVAIIANSGFTNPLLIEDDGTIIAGHGRLEAATRLGMTEVPCIRVSGLSPAQIKALRLSDNKIGLVSSWDDDTLRAEIEALAEGGYDLDLIGFDAGEIQNLLLPREEGENDADAEWQGMPEFAQTDKKAFRSLVVHFKDQAAVDEFVTRTEFRLTSKTRFAWFPEIEIETYADKRYE